MEPSPEAALWRAVIVQAIEDACEKPRPSRAKRMPLSSRPCTAQGRESTKRCKAREREAARHWLIDDTNDFRAVCHMAGLEPGAVLMMAEQLMEQGWPPRREPALAA